MLVILVGSWGWFYILYFYGVWVIDNIVILMWEDNEKGY